MYPTGRYLNSKEWRPARVLAVWQPGPAFDVAFQNGRVQERLPRASVRDENAARVRALLCCLHARR